jgi:hypothetical protein
MIEVCNQGDMTLMVSNATEKQVIGSASRWGRRSEIITASSNISVLANP